MAAATIVNASWGYRATTGTDETAVTTQRVHLKSIQVRGTGGGETVTVKDAEGNIMLIQVTTVANHTYEIPWYGARIDGGMTVTLSAATVSANFLVG